MNEHRREQNRRSAETRRRRLGMENRKERSQAIRQGIIDVWHENPGASYEFIARLIGCSWITVLRHVKKMREQLEESGTMTD